MANGVRTVELTRRFVEFVRGLSLRHFLPSELLVHVGGRRGKVINSFPPEELWENIVPTIRLLDEFREVWGAPVYLISVWRDPAYNRAVGGVPQSQHTQFRAIDFTSARGRPMDWFRLLREWRQEGRFAGGLGVYPRKGFVHLDTRGYNATWQGR